MTREDAIAKLKEIKDTPVPVGAEEVGALNADAIFKVLDFIADWAPWLALIPGAGPIASIIALVVPHMPRIKEAVEVIVDLINSFTDRDEGIRAAKEAIAEASA